MKYRNPNILRVKSILKSKNIRWGEVAQLSANEISVRNISYLGSTEFDNNEVMVARNALADMGYKSNIQPRTKANGKTTYTMRLYR